MDQLSKGIGELKVAVSDAYWQSATGIIQRLLVINELRMAIHEVEHHGKKGNAEALAKGISGALAHIELDLRELSS